VLFSLFIVLKFVPKDIVNLVISVYFSAIGAVSLSSMIEPFSSPLLVIMGSVYSKSFGGTYDVPLLGPVALTATGGQIGCLVMSAPVALLYFKTKYWLLNNVLGVTFCILGIESVSLGSIKVGAILLSGLFLYDIFWVFGTDKMLTGDSVMVTVAKGLDAPIKLLFPRIASNASAVVAAVAEMAAEGATTAVIKPIVTNFFGDHLEFSMLGLGDIVIPGFFLALLLRFDAEQARADPTRGAVGSFSRPYFCAVLVAYIVGLVTTVLAMERFKAAQPALLYLVPAVLGTTLLVGAARGELKALFAYSEETNDKEVLKKSD
jgi:minor histocompatibility antigen H13